MKPKSRDKAIPSKDTRRLKMKYIIVDEIENVNYLVDKKGKIYNREGKPMKYHRSWNGYDRVRLQRGTPRAMYLVHRVVAETYLSKPDEFNVVNHKNNNRSDNKVSNLEWVNNSMNQKQRFRSGHEPTKQAPISQFDMLNNWIRDFKTMKEAQEFTGIQYTNISKVCRGLRKSAGGYIWKYKK